MTLTFSQVTKTFPFPWYCPTALNHPSVHLHAENGDDQLQLLRKDYGDHLQAEEGENHVQLNPERQVGHLKAEVGEDQAQLLTECSGDPLQAEVGKIKSNSLQNAMEINDI